MSGANAEIEKAFAGRARPRSLVDRTRPELDDVEDARAFEGLDWRDAGPDLWHEQFGAFYGLRPDAFAYFLPSILRLPRDGGDLALPAHSLLRMLDRSPDAALWDEFMSSRMTILSRAELRAVEVWLLTLNDERPDLKSALDRALATISLLADRQQ